MIILNTALIIVWNIIGGIVFSAIASNYGINKPDYHILSPAHIYDIHLVNAFGAVLIAIVYNILCPAITVAYWFYKLCTVGRKRK